MSAGIATERWKVDEMRRMWASGEPVGHIATQLEVSEITVTRYCVDVPKTASNRMTVVHRQRLLTSWACCG